MRKYAVFPKAEYFRRQRACYSHHAGKTGGKGVEKTMLDRTSLVITILGAINWLLVGLFQFDLVAYICGGQAAVVSRVIYTIVGIAGLWCISLLFRERHPAREGE